MKCKDCEHFRITAPANMPYEMGQAECKKHDLVTNFTRKSKLNTLTCIENGKETDRSE